MIVDRAQVAAALPGYELGDVLGRGGFGLVLAARHRELGRRAAVKVVPAASTAEAQLLASMDHPHIVRVHDCVRADDLCLIVMELLGGGTLARRGPMAPETACAAGLAVAAALSSAHAQGVLHRDVKPGNVLFDSAGLLKVTDFGIAKIVEGAAGTASVAGLGTPAYMAPEQIQGGRLGPATDVYALGVLLHRLLTGAPPFDPTLPVQALWQHHLTTVPAPPAGVPAPVTAVILAALAKNPAARPPSALAFAVELAAAAAASYGPRWTARCGLVLFLDDDVRAAADGDRSARTPAAVEWGEWATREAPGPDPVLLIPADPYPTVPPDPVPVIPPDPVPVIPPDPVPVIPPDPVPVIPPDPEPVAPSDRGPDVLPGTRRTPPPHPIGGDVPRRGNGRAGRRRLALGGGLVALVLAAAVAAAVALTPGRDPAGMAAPPSPAGSTGPTPSPAIPAPRTPTPTATRGTPVAATAAALRPLDALTEHTGAVFAVAFAPDGHTLATGASDGTIRLWDTAGPGSPRRLGAPLVVTDAVWSVAFSPDGRRLAAGSGSSTGSVQVWDVVDRTAPKSLGGPAADSTGPVNTVAFSPDSRTLASGSGTNAGLILLWDVTGGSVRRLGRIDHDVRRDQADGIFSVLFLPGSHTLAASSLDTTVGLWDVSDPKAPHALGEPLRAFADNDVTLAFSAAGGIGAAGGILATGSSDDAVHLWQVSADRTSLRPFGRSLAGDGPVCFSPDGSLAAVGDSDALHLWDLAAPDAPRPQGTAVRGHDSLIESVACSPDGRTLASGSQDSTVRIWSLG
ncbi:WD40 repeat domain-containing serine/threonine protein kinase [Frankia sp. QA3]|uniref:WD40 repeat domain-containing serine/threonine protein kinase n=1 Tax=Frankia sp. QA3 TaxID=710111 RepID=UPI000269CF25|nr:protein kinase [Frankia sp. QA3]EIV96290.1 protein kinase with WD domain [Frankia sp. QA3]